MGKANVIILSSLALICGLQSPSAHADIWGDIGHAVESGVANLGKAAGDVIKA